MTNKKKQPFFLRLSPGALPCTDSHIFANPFELILFTRAHQTGPILFRVKFKKKSFISYFSYCNFPFNSTESERIMSFFVVHFGYTHAQTTIYSRKYAEFFKRVQIVFWNGLSLDLLVALEEEKDSWIVYVFLIWCSTARIMGDRFDSSNEHSWPWFACMCVSNLLAFQLFRGEGVVKLERI